MADLDDPPHDPSGGDPRAKGAHGDEQHISFVQRLENHFGGAVDPEIDLQDGEYREDSGAQLSQEASDQESSSSSRALVRKLAESVQLGARFKIKREIARGGMGVIFRVWDQDLRRNLAMKVMHSNSALEESGRPEDLNQEKLGRFLEEAQITGQLDHPGIVPVHDLGIDGKGRCYFTMRLVRGRELKEVLDLMRAGKENWTRTRVLSLVLKICESMAFAHSKGVVHRDLKPQNVMVGRFGEVYVMDWGLARVLGRHDSHDIRLKPEADEPSALSLVRTVRKDDSEANPDSSLVTMDGDVVGTPSFMAVEQAQGKLDQVGVRSDVYSLGSILYYMLTGRSPYVTPGERASPHTVLNRVLQGPPDPVSMHAKDEPAELVAICEKAMHRDASQRYASMLAVAEDIQAYLEDRVVGAYEGGSLAEARKWISRNRGIAMATAALLVLSLASAIGFAAMKQKRIASLEQKDLLVQESLKKEQESLLVAKRERDEAQRQKSLAEASLAQANESEKQANHNAEQANRAGYYSKILAADFSLRLDDVKEARTQLRSSGEQFRDWEHRHLGLRTSDALTEIDSLKKKSGRSNGSYVRHKGPIDQVSWSASGDQLALLTREGWLRFMEPESGAAAQGEDIQLKHTSSLLRASGLIPDMSFNLDGSRVALVGFDHQVYVFDAASRSPLMDLPKGSDPGHSGRVSEVLYSPSDDRLMTGSDSGEVVLWGADGSMHSRSNRRGQAVTALAWSPSGDHWAAGFSDGVALVWESSQPQFEIHRLEGHAGAINELVFSPDGLYLYSAGEDGKLNTWTRGGGRLVSSLAGHRRALMAMDCDPISGHVVTASRDQTLRVWDMKSGRSRVLLGHEAEVRSVRYSRDGSRIVSSDLDGSVRIWDAEEVSYITDLEPMGAGVTSLALDASGELLASADGQGRLMLWDAKAGVPRARLVGHRMGKKITALCFDQKGEYLFSASEDGTVRRWNTATGRQSASYKHSEPVTGLALFEDDLASARLFTTSGRHIFVFQVDTRIELSRLEVSPRKVSGLGVHGAGQLLACTDSTALILWNADGEGKPRRLELLGSQGLLALAPNGKQVVTSSHRGDVRGWNLAGDQSTALPMESSFGINAIGYHPEGRRFATGSRDGSLRIWDSSTGEILLTLMWSDEDIQSIAFDAEGERLVTGSRSGAIRIWESDSAAERRQYRLEERSLRAALAPEVERLFQEHFFLADVLTAIEELDRLDPRQRDCARLLARLRGDDPAFHAAESLACSMASERASADYARAMRQANAALQMSADPHSPLLLLALGAASYRVGDRARAGSWLAEAQARDAALRAQPSGLTRPLDPEAALALTLFQALASHQRGRTQEAERFFGQANIVLQGMDLSTLSEALSNLVSEVSEQ